TYPFHPVLWSEGQAKQLPAMTGRSVAVNASGLIVGYDTDESDHYVGWTYLNGKKTTLAKLAGYSWTVPAAVNARGDVAGRAMGDALDKTAPVVWPADRPGTVRRLTVPPGVGYPGVIDSHATDIGDDGTVVGSVRGVPMRWLPDGTPRA